MSLASLPISKQNALISHCASAELVWEDFYRDSAIKSIVGDKYELLNQYRDESLLNSRLDKLTAKGIQIVDITSKAYPYTLKHIFDPPNLLYAMGDTSLLNSKCVAVVGTRHSTVYGKNTTLAFSKDLSESGVTVVSGLATGIDTYAHKATILHSGKTIAVIAGGFDHIHPANNFQLSRDIASKGLLLSEYLPNVVPMQYMFVARNRIVAGMSSGIIVVEAGLKSGAKITANLGLEYGKTIYCVPGNINSPQSIGTNDLIKQGATLVTSGIEVATDLGFLSTSSTQADIPIGPQLDMLEQQVYDLIVQDGKVSLDVMIEKLNFGIRELNAMLLNMEINGVISRLPNNMFSVL